MPPHFNTHPAPGLSGLGISVPTRPPVTVDSPVPSLNYRQPDLLAIGLQPEAIDGPTTPVNSPVKRNRWDSFKRSFGLNRGRKTSSTLPTPSSSPASSKWSFRGKKPLVSSPITAEPVTPSNNEHISINEFLRADKDALQQSLARQLAAKSPSVSSPSEHGARSLGVQTQIPVAPSGLVPAPSVAVGYPNPRLQPARAFESINGPIQDRPFLDCAPGETPDTRRRHLESQPATTSLVDSPRSPEMPMPDMRTPSKSAGNVLKPGNADRVIATQKGSPAYRVSKRHSLTRTSMSRRFSTSLEPFTLSDTDEDDDVFKVDEKDSDLVPKGLQITKTKTRPASPTPAPIPTPESTQTILPSGRPAQSVQSPPSSARVGKKENVPTKAPRLPRAPTTPGSPCPQTAPVYPPPFIYPPLDTIGQPDMPDDYLGRPDWRLLHQKKGLEKRDPQTKDQRKFGATLIQSYEALSPLPTASPLPTHQTSDTSTLHNVNNEKRAIEHGIGQAITCDDKPPAKPVQEKPVQASPSPCENDELIRLLDSTVKLDGVFQVARQNRALVPALRAFIERERAAALRHSGAQQVHLVNAASQVSSSGVVVQSPEAPDLSRSLFKNGEMSQADTKELTSGTDDHSAEVDSSRRIGESASQHNTSNVVPSLTEPSSCYTEPKEPNTDRSGANTSSNATIKDESAIKSDTDQAEPTVQAEEAKSVVFLPRVYKPLFQWDIDATETDRELQRQKMREQAAKEAKKKAEQEAAKQEALRQEQLKKEAKERKKAAFKATLSQMTPSIFHSSKRAEARDSAKTKNVEFEQEEVRTPYSINRAYAYETGNPALLYAITPWSESNPQLRTSTRTVSQGEVRFTNLDRPPAQTKSNLPTKVKPQTSTARNAPNDMSRSDVIAESTSLLNRPQPLRSPKRPPSPRMPGDDKAVVKAESTKSVAISESESTDTPSSLNQSQSWRSPVMSSQNDAAIKAESSKHVATPRKERQVRFADPEPSFPDPPSFNSALRELKAGLENDAKSMNHIVEKNSWSSLRSQPSSQRVDPAPAASSAVPSVPEIPQQFQGMNRAVVSPSNIPVSTSCMRQQPSQTLARGPAPPSNIPLPAQSLRQQSSRSVLVNLPVPALSATQRPAQNISQAAAASVPSSMLSGHQHLQYTDRAPNSASNTYVVSPYSQQAYDMERASTTSSSTYGASLRQQSSQASLNASSATSDTQTPSSSSMSPPARAVDASNDKGKGTSRPRPKYSLYPTEMKYPDGDVPPLAYYSSIPPDMRTEEQEAALARYVLPSMHYTEEEAAAASAERIREKEKRRAEALAKQALAESSYRQQSMHNSVLASAANPYPSSLRSRPSLSASERIGEPRPASRLRRQAVEVADRSSAGTTNASTSSSTFSPRRVPSNETISDVTSHASTSTLGSTRVQPSNYGSTSRSAAPSSFNQTHERAGMSHGHTRERFPTMNTIRPPRMMAPPEEEFVVDPSAFPLPPRSTSSSSQGHSPYGVDEASSSQETIRPSRQPVAAGPSAQREVAQPHSSTKTITSTKSWRALPKANYGQQGLTRQLSLRNVSAPIPEDEYEGYKPLSTWKERE